MKYCISVRVTAVVPGSPSAAAVQPILSTTLGSQFYFSFT